MVKEKWYPLDNAAQIFPIISKKGDTNSFRISCVLRSNIDKDILRLALIETLNRYPTIAVRLKKGVFWYYLEHNDKDPIVREEDPNYCESNDYSLQNDYLFNVSYFGKRIALEMSHSVTDGNGGLEFFKSIIYNYLLLKGYSIKNKGEILTDDVEQLIDESQDSFVYNYKDKIIKTKQETKGFSIKGKSHSVRWTDCIQANIDTTSLKDASKKYNCTVTQYIASLLIYNIYNEYVKKSDCKFPIRLFIPVNARKYFQSKTLRNFVLFIRTTSLFEGDINFLDVVKHVKETFTEELNNEKLLARIKANIRLEKNIFVRFLILPIKYIIVRLCFKSFGTNVNTLSFSNLGNVTIPKEMYQYIDRLEFANGATKDAPINVGLVSLANKSVLTFTSAIIERNLQRSVIQMLQNDGVKLIVTTNDLEV